MPLARLFNRSLRRCFQGRLPPPEGPILLAMACCLGQFNLDMTCVKKKIGKGEALLKKV
jgi:hypothetical protein